MNIIQEEEEMKIDLSILTKPRLFDRFNAQVVNHSYSKYANRFVVFIDFLAASTISLPNQTLMADVGAHPDSFPSTHPFDFTSAMYFIMMVRLLGSSIASSFTGAISDKVGRRPVILMCIITHLLGVILQWFCRKSFWAFSSAQFVSGLLSASLPVSLAYSSEILESKEDKEKEFGILIAGGMFGQAIGGVIAMVMFPLGLFAPLWVGFGLLIVSFLVCFCYLAEQNMLEDMIDEDSFDNNDDDDDNNDDDGDSSDDVDTNSCEEQSLALPQHIDIKTMAIILNGSVFDLFGSTTLIPMCLSPLAYKVFYQDFINQGIQPIMSVYWYQGL